MRFLRTLLPFLFVRNWYTGDWEISRLRILLFILFLVGFGALTAVIITFQAPIEYSVASLGVLIGK